MRLLKKILAIIEMVIIMITMMFPYNNEEVYAQTINEKQNPVKVGVLLYRFDDVYISLVRQSLEEIQKENPNKVQFTFFNGESNPDIETANLNYMIQNNYDIILASFMDNRGPEIIQEFVYKAKEKDIPIIFFNISPTKLDIIKEYSKSLIINNDFQQAGVLQGKMIADYWNANKGILDKNGDNIMQYILLKGEAGSSLSEARAKYTILTINDAGIKTQELASISANWNEELAKNFTESLFQKYGDKIEVIIANNDSMGIGAIKAIQNHGYNTDNKDKIIPVFGINATTEAQVLINKGIMTGSVPQDPRALADALYTVGMNLVSGNNPLEGTNYKFDETGVIIRIP